MKPNQNEEYEIKKCFDSWTECYNQGNLNGYLEAYADSEYTRYVNGSNIIIGIQNIRDLVHSRGSNGVLSLEHFQVDMISDHDAICFGQYRLHVKTDGNDSFAKHKGCFTVHVRKFEGAWKIWSDHSS